MSLMERIAAGSHWYRRLSIMSLLITGALILLYVVLLIDAHAVDSSLHISIFVAVLSSITSIMAITALLHGAKHTNAALLDTVTFALLASTISLLIYETGGMASPYMPLWLLVATFGGLFGLIGLSTLAVISNLFIIWAVTVPSSENTLDRLVLALLTAELPLIVSYVIWHKRPGAQATHEATQALQAKLTETSSQAEVVVNSIADGVIAIDRQGSIQLINPAAQSLLGWKKSDALHLDYELVLKLVDKREQQLTSGQNPIEQVRVTKQPIINNDLTLIAAADRKLLVSLVVSPIISNTNDVEAVIVVLRDITAEKAQERSQAEFISTASHEMRTPVAAIEGYVGLALNPATANIDEKARAYLLKAQASVQHLGHLFQDLLSVSRADDNRLEQHPVVTDIVAFAREITDSLKQKAEEKKLIINYVPDNSADVSRKLAPIFYSNIDRDHFREVLANLIENAIKYTPAGEVKVDVTSDEKRVVVSVTDSGIGIPSEDIPHLFQKFYRVDNSATREIGGTGLGLYLCRKLIESMGGKIWLESEWKKGSSFFVSLQRLNSTDIKALKDAETITALNNTAKQASAFQPQVAATIAPAPTTSAPAAPVAATPPVAQVQPAAAQAPTMAAAPSVIPIAAQATTINDVNKTTSQSMQSVTPPQPLQPLIPAQPRPISDVLQTSQVSAPLPTPAASNQTARPGLIAPARQAKV